MPNFTYTHTRRVDSSAVDEVYYNENTKELAVDLHDEVYVYPNVPLARYEALVGASSVGRAFREVKRDYGPSSYLGYATQVNYVRETTKAPSMAAVGTPKGLTYAEDAVVDGRPVASPNEVRVDLGLAPVAAPGGVKFRHAVYFEVEGLGNGSKVYNVEAGSVNEAVEALSEATAALGLDVNVKEVRVYFE